LICFLQSLISRCWDSFLPTPRMKTVLVFSSGWTYRRHSLDDLTPVCPIRYRPSLSDRKNEHWRTTRGKAIPSLSSASIFSRLARHETSSRSWFFEKCLNLEGKSSRSGENSHNICIKRNQNHKKLQKSQEIYQKRGKYTTITARPFIGQTEPPYLPQGTRDPSHPRAASSSGSNTSTRTLLTSANASSTRARTTSPHLSGNPIPHLGFGLPSRPGKSPKKSCACFTS